MSETITVKTRKVMRNPLLSRKQMIVDVMHPGKPAQPKTEVAKLIAKLHKVDEKVRRAPTASALAARPPSPPASLPPPTPPLRTTPSPARLVARCHV